MVMDLETTRTQVRLDTPSSTGTEITRKPFLHTRLLSSQKGGGGYEGQEWPVPP